MQKPLEGRRVLVTGVGLREVRHVFEDRVTGQPTHTPIRTGSTECKANIGAAVALCCARLGAAVHLVARTESKLQAVKEWVLDELGLSSESPANPGITYSAVDLGSELDISRMVNDISDDLPLSWVQSLGLGAGTVRLQDDNPYLPISGLTQELITAELSVLTSTIATLQLLLPRLRKQSESRICVVTSMSAVRSITSGAIHAAAKGALSRFTNAGMLELTRDGIYLTDVRPGGVDTGIYDNPKVQETIAQARRDYGYEGPLRLIPALDVGELIAQVLASHGHVTTLSMSARGQMPHTAS